MPFYALGLNHHSAPIAIRERFAFDPQRVVPALQELCGGVAGVSEAAILSTCNRTELYVAAREAEPVVAWLIARQGTPLPEVAPHLFTYIDQAAVRHVFRVASGLDSMVLGEAQILGQFKDAVRAAQAAGTLGKHLHKLFQHTLAVAKEVRSGTAIGANVVSMAAAAVKLSERVFGPVSEQRVLFVGAGEMIELCATHFAAGRPRRMMVVNRTLARAEAIAQPLGAGVGRLEDLPEILPEFDTVVSSTASPLPLIGLGMVERALKKRRRRPFVMVDLAVPRDVEPEVGELDDVFLYTVDDLAQIVQAGLASRQQALVAAERIVEERVAEFMAWVRSREIVPWIHRLRERADALREAELQRALRRLHGGESPEAVLMALSHGLMNKWLHAPTRFLQEAAEPEREALLAALPRLFALEEGTPPAKDGEEDAAQEESLPLAVPRGERG